MFLSALIFGQFLAETLDIEHNYACSSRLVSSVALLYSISSDHFDVIFLCSSRKKVFNIKNFLYVYIIIIE